MNIRLIAIILITSLGLVGCSVNPVTGKKEISLVSAQQEVQIGEKQYAPLRQSQGGDYVVDPNLTAYVNGIGQKLAAVSDRSGLPYEFKVLNNSVPNAWALPGGKIVINRGLLVELGSEAELAAVLGHEIVHAAARHGAQGMTRGMLLQTGVAVATVASQGEDYAALAQVGAGLGAQLVNSKYGRDAERESDLYGMQYMSKAGYDPQAAVQLQETFVRLSQGRKGGWAQGLFASHPPSQERVQNNRAIVKTLPAGGEMGAEKYKNTIRRLLKTEDAYKAYDEGRKALASGDTRQALSLAKKAIAKEPREAHFYALLGDVEKKNKRQNSAMKHYTRAINLNSNFFYYYLQRGLLQEKSGNLKNAEQDLNRSLQLLPTDQANLSLGNIAKRSGNINQAKKYYASIAAPKGEANIAAYNELLELDLKDNPSKYIKTRTGLDKNNQLVLVIENPTPQAMTDLVLAIELPNGKTQSRKLGGAIAAGSREQVVLDQGPISAEVARAIKTQIVQARIAK